MSWEDSIYTRFAKQLYLLSGLPVNIHNIRFTSVQKIYTAFALSAYAVVAVSYLHLLILEQHEDNNRHSMYLNVFWVIYTIGHFMSAINNVLKRRSLAAIWLRVQKIQNFTSANNIRVGTSRAKRILLATSVLAITLSELQDAFEFLEVSAKGFALVLKAALLLIHLPLFFMFWATLYHSSLQYLTESEFIKSICDELINLNSEEDRLVSPAVGSAGSGDSSRTLLRYKLLHRMFSEIKWLRLEIGAWHQGGLSFLLFTTACYFPILLSSTTGRDEGSNSPERILKLAYIAVGTLVKIAPILSAQLAKHRKTCLIQKLAIKHIDCADEELKRTLMKFINSAKDTYPESAYYFLDFDITLLATLFDAVVLTTMTFFT